MIALPAAPGDSDGGAGGGNNGMTPSPTQLPGVDACGSDASLPGPRVLRRLTQAQLNATLKDLFRDPTVPQAGFLSDTPVLGFTVDANALVVQDLTAQQLMDFGEQVATFVDTHTASVTTCTTTDAACVQSFVSGFGKRAFRAPLSPVQLNAYTALFNAQGSFAAGTHAVVQAMMQSPYFLYRQELGEASAPSPALYRLSQYEIASSLSYLLVGSMPDDALLAAADGNQLATTAQVDAQAARLLADPRALTVVADFMTGWLGLDRVLTSVKDATVYSALTDVVRKSLYVESRTLLIDRFTNGGTFADALTADYSFLDTNLSQYYGIPGGGTNPMRVTLPAGVRDKGLLAHGAILTGYADADISSPVQRGKMVRTRLLCQSLPPPPGNLAPALPPPMGVQTTRQHFEAHDKMQPCASCHQFLDPVGFAFEHYDGIGRYRVTEGALPIDSSGMVKAMVSGQSDFSFGGLDDLTHYLASDSDVNSCMARYWSYYAFGMASWAQDGCTQNAINAAAQTAGYTLKSVLTAILHTPHFVSRVQDQ